MVQPKRIPVKEKRNGPVLYNSRVKNEFKVSLNFSTISPDGLLLWIQSENRYLGLGIQNGQMKFASNLLDGSENGIFEMPNGGFVSDGGENIIISLFLIYWDKTKQNKNPNLKIIIKTGWHNVQLEINERTVTFTVDDRPIFTENKKPIAAVAVELFDLEKNLFYIGESLMNAWQLHYGFFLFRLIHMNWISFLFHFVYYSKNDFGKLPTLTVTYNYYL